MDQNFDYTSFFIPNILIFKLFGFWKPDEDMKFKILYNVYTVLCTLIWMTLWLSQTIYIALNKKDVIEVTAALYVTVTLSMDLTKMLFVYKNMDQIKVLIKDLNRPLFQVKSKKHLEIVEGTKRLNKIMFYSCFYISLQTEIFWSFIPFLAKERTTLAKGWFPYDWDKPLNYELTYLFQNSVIFWNVMICANLDTFTSTLLIQVGLQCDLLCATLNSLDDFYVDEGVLYETSPEKKLELRKDIRTFSDAMTRNLTICIHHHREIMRMASNIQDVLKTSVLVLFGGGAITICSCLFQLSIVNVGELEFFMLLFYLLCMITEQFFYCWFGNEVICKSSKILQSAYNTPWTDCDLKFRKLLLQFMTQNQRPIELTAGGLFTMSLSVFISVIRTSYSYFTLLQNIQ